jgi:hypothetical protein
MESIRVIERSYIYNSNSISRAIYNFVNIYTLMKIFQHGPIDGTNSPLPFRHLPKMHQPKLPNLLPNPHRPTLHLLHNRHAQRYIYKYSKAPNSNPYPSTQTATNACHPTHTFTTLHLQ